MLFEDVLACERRFEDEAPYLARGGEEVTPRSTVSAAELSYSRITWLVAGKRWEPLFSVL